jgi:hypothetical protein
MAKSRNPTACCGLYCADCNRSKAEFFQLAAALEQWLADLKFDQYAAYKAAQTPLFAEYPAFARVLKGIGELACVTCADEANASPCRIRKCVLDKGIAGCWDCADASTCDILAPIVRAHPAVERNHRCIRQYGLDDWSGQRGKHYSWD